MPADAPKRKRTSTPRSKNGCGVCRARRVKCDEIRPRCQQCKRLGLTCWYEAHRGSGPSTGSNTSLARLPIPVYILPFSVGGAPSERRAFHYYINSAATNLSGHTNDIFWTKILPQRCEHEHVLRHCLIALSCTHLEYCDSELASNNVSEDGLDHCSVETLEAYGKAVSKLRRYMDTKSQPDARLVLMCILVLYTFERLRKNTEAAMAHLDNGIRILQASIASRLRKAADTLDGDMEALRLAFARHDAGATMYDLERVPEMHMLPRDLELSIDNVQSRFGTLSALHHFITSAIRHPLLVLISQTLALRTRPRPHVRQLLLQEAAHIGSRLNLWAKTANVYENAHESLGKHTYAALCRDAIAFCVARVQYCACKALLGESLGLLSPSITKQIDTNSLIESSWDQIAHELIRHAEHYIALRRTLKSLATEATLKRAWCPEPGIMGPLVLLCKKTKVAGVQSSALTLMRELTRLESVDGTVGYEITSLGSTSLNWFVVE